MMRRKSHAMRLVELNYKDEEGNPGTIEEIICSRLVHHEGYQTKVAEEFGITQGTMSNWINILGIHARVREIRKNFGHRVKEAFGTFSGGSLNVEGGCHECNRKVEELEVKDIKVKETKVGMEVLIWDGEEEHRFTLM